MSLAAFADEPILLSLYHYWKRKRGGRRMPGRKDIDPSELKASVLPYLALAEFVDGGTHVRLRLAGAELERAFGRSLMGVALEDVMSGDYLEFINRLFHDVQQHKAPIYSESIFRWGPEIFRRPRRLYMPLGDDEVRMVLIGQTSSGPSMTSVKNREPIAGQLGPQGSITEIVREIVSG